MVIMVKLDPVQPHPITDRHYVYLQVRTGLGERFSIFCARALGSEFKGLSDGAFLLAPGQVDEDGQALENLEGGPPQ
eukprot:2535434-Pyramimonas_sp.AAC.1